MAKNSQIARWKRPAKFSTRKYNRCSICGRSGGYLRRFQLCRICLQGAGLAGVNPWCEEGQLVKMGVKCQGQI